MKRYGRLMDEIDRDTSKLNIGISKERVIKLIGRPDYRSDHQTVAQIRKVEVLEYEVYKGILSLVFQSDTLINKYYLEF